MLFFLLSWCSISYQQKNTHLYQRLHQVTHRSVGEKVSLLLIDYDQNCNEIVGAYYDIQCTFSAPLKLILASIGRIISFFRKSIFALIYCFHLVFFREIFGNWVYFMFVQVLYYYHPWIGLDWYYNAQEHFGRAHKIRPYSQNSEQLQSV